MIISILVAFAVLAIFKIDANYLVVSKDTESLGLGESRPYDQYPLILLLLWSLTLAPFFLVPVVLLLLIQGYLPPDIPRWLMGYQIQLNFLFAVLQITAVTYSVLHASDTYMLSALRRLDMIWYVVFQGNAALATALIGWRAYRGKVFPASICITLMVGGAASLGLTIIGANPELPILRYGLLFLPYCAALLILAAYLWLVTTSSQLTAPSSTDKTISLDHTL